MGIAVQQIESGQAGQLLHQFDAGTGVGGTPGNQVRLPGEGCLDAHHRVGIVGTQQLETDVAAKHFHGDLAIVWLQR